MRKLGSKGFSHHVLLVIFVVVFAVAGVGYLVASHASSKKCIYHTYGYNSRTNKGSVGHCVTDIQTILKKSYTPNLAVDGKYGPKTKAAVVRYQKDLHLKPDGVVGKKTWRYLCATGRLYASAYAEVYHASDDAGCYKL